MKRNALSGTGTVAWFTFKQTVRSKSWVILTILIAALCLLGIPLLLFTLVHADAVDTPDPDAAFVKTVFVCDETEGDADYTVLQGIAGYEEVTYQMQPDMETAMQAMTEPDSTLVMRVHQDANAAYCLTAYLPDETELERSTASSYVESVKQYFSLILMQKASMTVEAMALLSQPIATSVAEQRADAEASDGIMNDLIDFIIPFLNIMLIYMMVLAYGQNMANSVMSEKISKLMETMLISVQPFALLLGKLLAIASAAILQVTIWIASFIIGTVFGVTVALLQVPETDQPFVVALDEIIDSGLLFSPINVILAIVILALGFLLYLALGGIGGAMASKAEDLGKTNMLFTLILVVCFCLCLSPDAESGEFMATETWLNYMPFTSILMLPGKLFLGEADVRTAGIAILILAVTVWLMVAIAALLYRMLVLYRGNVPTAKQLLSMLRDEKK